MIGMRVRQQNRVERRQLVECDSRRRDSRQDATESRIEIWIREKLDAAQLEQQRRVADIGDFHNGCAGPQLQDPNASAMPRSCALRVLQPPLLPALASQ